MPLISLKRNIPAYAMMSGGANFNGAVSTVLFNFANNFIAANNITKDSNSRITVREGGYYEIKIPLSVFMVASANVTASFQYGVSGNWTNISTSNVANTLQSYGDIYRLIIPMAANDYLEFRSVSSGAVTQHNTNCRPTGIDGLFPVLTIKKLRR